MQEKLTQFVDIVKADPAVDNVRGVHRRQPGEHQHRPDVHVVEAAGRTQAQRAPGHRAAAPEARCRARRQPVPASDSGPAHRRPAERRRVSVHAAGRRSARAEALGAAHAAQDADAAGLARRQQRPAGSRAAGRGRDRPRHRLAAGHHAADDRRRAVRRLRAAAGVDDVHRVEPVSRGDGSGAAILAEPRNAARHLRALDATACRCR